MCIEDKPCTECGEEEWCGVEYYYTHPEHYDGVSEWKCMKCGARWGRWTEKRLAEGEIEKRYGNE